MFNKERFHNSLAINMGCKRLIDNKRFSININYDINFNDPWVTVQVEGHILCIGFYASDDFQKDILAGRLSKEQHEIIEVLNFCDELNEIVDAVHTSYLEATQRLF